MFGVDPKRIQEWCKKEDHIENTATEKEQQANNCLVEVQRK